MFSGWHQARGYLCGGSSLSCTITTVFLAGKASLEALLDADFDVYLLQPAFVPDPHAGRYDVAQWQNFLQTFGGTSDNFLYHAQPDAGNSAAGVLKTGDNKSQP